MFKALNNKRNSHVAQLQKINSKMNRNPHKAHQQFTLISMSPSVHPLGDPAPQTSPGEQDLARGQQISISRGTGGKSSPSSSVQAQEALWEMPRGSGQLSGLGWAGTEQEGTSPSAAGPSWDTGTEGEGRNPRAGSCHSTPSITALQGCKVIL